MTCEQKCHRIITRLGTPSMHSQAHAVTAYGAIADQITGGAGGGATVLESR